MTGGILTDFCVALDEILDNQPSRLPEMDCSGVMGTSMDATREIQSGIVTAIANANADIAGISHPTGGIMLFWHETAVKCADPLP